MRVKSSKIKKRTKKNIFTKRNSDRLLSTDSQKRDEEVLDSATVTENTLEINLNVDKKDFFLSEVEKVEVLISEEPLEIINKKIPITKDMSRKNTDPKKVNLRFKNINKIRKVKIKDKNKKLKKITDLSTDTVLDMSKLSIRKLRSQPDEVTFGTKKQINVIKTSSPKVKKRNQLEIQRNLPSVIEEQNQTIVPKIKQEVKKIKREKKDLAEILQKDIAKSVPQNLIQRVKGSIDAGNKNTSSVKNRVAEKVNNIVRSKTSTAKTDYIIQKKRVVNRNATIAKKVKLNNNIMKKYSKEKDVHLIYRVKDKKGKVLQNIPSKIDTYKERKKTNEIPSLNYKIKGYRKNNRIYIKISNESKRNCYFNVYMKKHHDLFHENNDEYTIVNKKVLVYKKNSVTLEHSNHTGTVTFRVLETNLNNVEYSNFLSSSVPGKEKQSLNVYAGLTAKINDQSQSYSKKSISIISKNMPNMQEYSGVQLVKRNLSKKEKTYKRVLDSLSGKPKIPSKISNNLVLIDEDVMNNNVYEYKLLLYDANKNKYFSSSSCVEEYENKTGTVSVSFIQEPIISSNILTATLTTNIEKKDSDRLFEDLFGDLYNLFEEDLKNIKDVNSISISHEVTMYNKATGDMIDVGIFSVDQQRQTRIAVFLPGDYDYYEEYCLKIKPRITPPAEILTNISTTIDRLGRKENFNPVSLFSTPAIKKKLSNKDKDVVSFTGNKFTSKMSRTKGKIEDRNSFLERTNFDFYFDGSTGDQIYYDLPADVFEDGILAEFVIRKLDDKRKNYRINKSQNLENDVKIKITGVYNYNSKNNIDFFIAAYEENGVIKNEGLAFAKNTTFNYMYDIKCPVGEINFLFIPVYKDGTIGEKIIAGTRHFNSEGAIK